MLIIKGLSETRREIESMTREKFPAADHGIFPCMTGTQASCL